MNDKYLDNEQRRKSLLIQLICAVVAFLGGVALVWVGMFVPPVGEIHPSVLTAFGEALTWSATVFGFITNVKIKLLKKNKCDESDETDK